MAKKRQLSPPEEPPSIESVASEVQDEVMEGETIDDYMARKDGEEGRKHDANESRYPDKWLDDWDPHLGCL